MNKQQTMSAEHSRRDILRTAWHGLAAGFAFPTIVPASALGLGGRVAPSNRVTVAVIGTGNQGSNDINSFLSDERVQIVAVCDVNRESADTGITRSAAASLPGAWSKSTMPSTSLLDAIRAATPASTSGRFLAARISTPWKSPRLTTGTPSR